MGTIGALVNRVRHFSRSELAKILASANGERLPGQPDQRIDEISPLQNFVIGSRRVVGMTVYHYAKMLTGYKVEVESDQFRGLCNTIDLDEPNTAAAPATQVAGSMTLSIVGAALAAHIYQNGRVTIWSAPPTEHQTIDILDNDAGDGTNTLLYLRTPLRITVPAGTMCSLARNIYSALALPAFFGTDLAPIVGIGQRFITDGYYFWLATFGLAQLAQGEPLDGLLSKDVYFSLRDGTGWKGNTVIGLVPPPINPQFAGHMALEQTSGIDTNIFLMLDP